VFVESDADAEGEELEGEVEDPTPGMPSLSLAEPRDISPTPGHGDGREWSRYGVERVRSLRIWQRSL